MPKRVSRKRPVSDKSIRKDGFVFASSGLDAVLVDYLYSQVPEGKRRDQMKRLMLLGLMQELGLNHDSSSFIPPRPIEMSGRVHPSSLVDPFLERSPATETINNERSRLIENDKGDALTVDERGSTVSITSSKRDEAELVSSLNDKERPNNDFPAVAEVTESSDDTINGLNIQAFMAFKG